jgi:rod shape-determining protein RodA
MPTKKRKFRLRLTSICIVATTLALICVGLAAIDVSQQAGGMSGLVTRQITYTLAAAGAFALCTLVPYQKIGRWAYIIFAFTLALLVLVLFLPANRGCHRWIGFGFFQVQPSELAKLSLIILLAWYLRLGDHYRRILGLIPPFVLTLVPMGLILREPDLGTSLLLLPTLYAMLFMAGAKVRHLLGIMAVGLAILLLPLPTSLDQLGPVETRERLATAYWTAGPADKPTVAYSAAALRTMKIHQLKRVNGWLRQGQADVIKGQGYQLFQSKIVLGSGKITGRGDWQHADIYFRNLPEDHTDFIFSIIAGQWGFLGCVGLFLLYGAVIVCGVEIAAGTTDPFGRLLAVGVLALTVTQIFINVGMTMGLMPITGMTLPLVSYGGSSLVVNCAAMGLLVNVSQRRPITLSRHPFEHDEDISHVPYRPMEGQFRTYPR